MNGRRIAFTLTLFLCATTCMSQITMLRQQKLKKWGIPAANYSGIAPLGGSRYAVVSDKQTEDGFYEMEILQDETTGEVEEVRLIAFHGNGNSCRDAEGISFMPSSGTIFISAEDDQRIMEYTAQGQLTGRELSVPKALSKANIYGNYGFEALSFCEETGLFWTCTENSLRSDSTLSSATNPVPALLRLQTFGTDLEPGHQYIYTTDAPDIRRKAMKSAIGVPEITALPDGSLLVLERDFIVTPKYSGSYVDNRIYLFQPESGKKTLQAEWTTKVNLTKRNIANYEGMCLGARLKDGRQTILLLSDSQNGYGNAFFHMKDYIKVGIMDKRT